MNNVYHGLTAEESELYTRLRGQQWLSEDGMAPKLTKAEDGELAALQKLMSKKHR